MSDLVKFSLKSIGIYYKIEMLAKIKSDIISIFSCSYVRSVRIPTSFLTFSHKTRLR